MRGLVGSVCAAVLGREPRDEVGVGGAAAGAGEVGAGGRPVEIAGAAEAVRAQRGLQQQRAVPPGVVDEHLHRHPAAHRVGDHQGPAAVPTEQVGVVEQRRQVVGEVAQAPGGVDRPGVGGAVAAQVGGDQAQVRREVADERIPEGAGRAVAVDQQDRHAVGRPGDVDVQGEAARLHPQLARLHAADPLSRPRTRQCGSLTQRKRFAWWTTHRPVPTRE